MATAVFDPTQPFEALAGPDVAAPKFNPSQPFEVPSPRAAAVPRFDPSQPFEPLTEPPIPRTEPPADLSRVPDARAPIFLDRNLRPAEPYHDPNAVIRPDTTGPVGRTMRVIGEKLEPITPKRTAFPFLNAADLAAGDFKHMFGDYDPETGEVSNSQFLPNAPAPTWAKVVTGGERGVATVAGAAVPWIIAGPLLGGATGVPIVARTVSAAFAADMIRQLPDQAKVFLNAVDKGDTQTAVQAAVGGTAGAILSALALHHAVAPSQVPTFDAFGNPVVDPATGEQAFTTRGIAEESPAIRSLLTKKIASEYTPEQIKEVYGRVNRGEANPAEQELVRFINTALEHPGQAARKGATVTEEIPRIESQFWRDYLGLKEGQKTIKLRLGTDDKGQPIFAEQPITTGATDATDSGKQQGQPGSEYPGTLSRQRIEAPGETQVESADIGHRPASPAGQPPEGANAAVEAAPVTPSAEPKVTIPAAEVPKTSPPPPPVEAPPEGERLVTVQRPDGTTYIASFGDKFYDWPGRGKVASIGFQDARGNWTHGMLPEGEKILGEPQPRGGAVQNEVPSQEKAQEEGQRRGLTPSQETKPKSKGPSEKQKEEVQGQGNVIPPAVAGASAPVAPTPAVGMSPIGDKTVKPATEPTDTLGNPESFYAVKSLMAARMRRSPKFTAATKFYQTTDVKRLNELATRRFAEMRERAAAEAKPPVVEAPAPTEEKSAEIIPKIIPPDPKVEIRNLRLELAKLQKKLDKELGQMGSMRPPSITAELVRTVGDKMAKVQDRIDALETQEAKTKGRKPISELPDADILKLAVSAGVGKPSKYFSDFQEAKSIRVRLQDLDDRGLLDRSVLEESAPVATPEPKPAKRDDVRNRLERALVEADTALAESGLPSHVRYADTVANTWGTLKPGGKAMSPEAMELRIQELQAAKDYFTKNATKPAAPPPPPKKPTEAPTVAPVEEKKTKAKLIEGLLGAKPPQSVANVEARVRWDKDSKELSKRSHEELTVMVSDKRISSVRESELADATKKIIPEVEAIAKAAGPRWRTELRSKADAEGARYPTAKNMSRGDVVYYVSRAIAEKRRAQPKPAEVAPTPEVPPAPSVETAKTPEIKSSLGRESFDSRISRTVEQSQQGKASGAQWKAMIRNSKLGANADEMALVGVGDLEDGKTYTRQEVLDYLKANEVVVKDVTLADKPPMTERERLAERDRLAQYRYGKNFDELTEGQRFNVNNDMNAETRNTTHFATYQLPGAKEGSYREILLTVPDTKQNVPITYKVVRFGTAAAIIRESDSKTVWSGKEISDADLQRLRDEYEKKTTPLVWRDGHSQYADIPNPIVRLRFNERTTADGKRMLFLEEVQAPQKGEFEKMPALFQKNWREIAFKWALRHAAENGFDSVGWTTGEQQAARYSLEKQVDEIRWSPVMADTAMAKKGNVQAVVITPKDLQPFRFYLDDKGIVHDSLTPGRAGDIEGKHISDVVGKEVGDRIISNHTGTLSGEGLKIGGVGLKKLYDSDFRNVVNNLPAVKKAGQKVGAAKINSDDPKRFAIAMDGSEWVVTEYGNPLESFSSFDRAKEYLDDSKEAGAGGFGETIHSLTITPEIRNSVLAGQALFRKGGTLGEPIGQPAVEKVVKEMLGGSIPKNLRFTNDPKLPRAQINLSTGEIDLNLAKLDSPELVRDTLREELIHAVWDSPEVADARKTIEDLITEVDRQRQAEEGYNPHETQEEAANERARRIFEDAENANIFVKAWRAIVEAIKKLFGLKLNADETARAAARTIVREAMKNEPTERSGVKGAEPITPTPEEKAVLESDAFKRNIDLADELGKIVPEEGESGVPTKVGNVEDMVLTRPGLNAAVREDSVSNAAAALREAGLNVIRAPDGLFDLADRTTPQEMAGNALVPILEREIQSARANNRPERIANLLNTVVVHLARDGNQAFSQTVKDQLYALAQSERSAYGRALGGLALWGNVLANIAQSPALHLHRIYSKAVGGPEVEGIIKKLLTVFRDFFSPEEIRKAVNPLNLNETARRLIQLKERDTGGRVYRQVQQRLRGTPPKTAEQKARRAVEDDAIESLIRQAASLGHVEPPKPKNQKLTPDEQLKLLTDPKVAAKVQEATEVAVQNAEFNAGWKAEANAARGDKEATADVAERKALGEEPSPEMIEEGLNLPEFAHWKDIRDNFLDYSPTTLKVVQDVIKGRFKGAKFGVTEPNPEELRIDFKKLATEPDVEVQRVFDAQVAAVKGLMDKATPATVARLSAIFRQNIEEQLARHRKETVDKLFKEQATGKESPTAIEALKKQINAGLLRDQRLSDAELAQRAADKSTLRNVLPSVTELVERIVSSPRYKMADIKTDVAAALVKELGLTDEAAANLSDLVYRALEGTDSKPGPLREASRKALEQVQTALSPADRKILFKKHVMAVNDIRGRKPGRTLWELIERGARAGLFDPTPVLETMARAIGFKVPTPEEKAKMKSWAEEEIRLRTPTQREIDAEQGTPEEKLAKATTKAEAGTESDRLDLIRKIQANWSRWSMPIGLRNFLDPTIKKNNAKAINELVAANLLAKVGFFFRQGLDVGLVSMPLNAANRALAHVLERAQNDGGFSPDTVKDLDAATREMVTARIASFKATLVAAARTAGGHTNRKVLDRMNHSVGIFERWRAKADELEAQGNMAGARALRVATLLQIGYRVAMTWDTIQSVGLEWQEMRQQLSTDLRAAGKTHAEIAATLDDVFGGIKLDMAEAVAEANAIAVERGLTKTKNAIQADAWNLIKAKAYDRMRTAAGTTTDYEAENEQYKELHSWNLPETGGVGGMIAETFKTLKKGSEKLGIPLGGMFSFGNAMGIAANRMLTFSGGGLFNGFGFGDSEWYKGERNRRQRRIEGMQGPAILALIIALMAAGKLIVQTKYPKDKAEKEKFTADGHRINTVRWQNDDGTWLEYPIQMAPFGFIASPLYMAGGVQQLLTDQAKAQAKLDADAARTGKVAGKAKPIDLGDVMGVLAQGAYGMLTGGRTASGAIQSFSDYGNFNLNRAVSGLVSPYIPGLPAWQEASRVLGAAMDTRTASILELLVPTPWSGHQRVNSLGDPLVNPNAVSRLAQVMSGGIGWGDSSLPDSGPYRALVQSGYATPAVNPNKGYDFGGTIRPMSGSELENYTVARGEAFKQELSGVNVDGLSEADAKKVVQAAYQRANRTALGSVGVSVPASASGSRTGVGASGAQTRTGGAVAAQGMGVPRVSSGLGPARGGATLRFARSPARGLRSPSRRGSLRIGFRRGPTISRRGTLRLPGGSPTRRRGMRLV